MPNDEIARIRLSVMMGASDLQRQQLDDGLKTQLQALQMKQARYNGFAAEMRNIAAMSRLSGPSADYREAQKWIAELARVKDEFRSGQLGAAPRLSAGTKEKILSLLTSPGTTLAREALSYATGPLATLAQGGKHALTAQGAINAALGGPIGSTLKSELMHDALTKEVFGTWSLSTKSIISEICKYVPSSAGFNAYFSPFSQVLGHIGPVGKIAIRHHTINKLYTLLAIYGQKPVNCGCINHSIPRIILQMENAIKDKTLGLHSGYGTYQAFKGLWDILVPKRFKSPGHAGPGDSAALPSGPEEWALPPSDPSVWARDLIAAAQLGQQVDLIPLDESNSAIMARVGHHTVDGGCPVALLALAALYGQGEIEKGRSLACATVIAGQSSLGQVKGLIG